ALLGQGDAGRQIVGRAFVVQKGRFLVGGAGVDGIAVVRHRRALSAIRASPLAFQAALLASSTWASASDTRAPSSSPRSRVGLPVLVSTSPARIIRPADSYSSWSRAFLSAAFWALMMRAASARAFWARSAAFSARTRAASLRPS